jgi:hypothetical protein
MQIEPPPALIALAVGGSPCPSQEFADLETLSSPDRFTSRDVSSTLPLIAFLYDKFITKRRSFITLYNKTPMFIDSSRSITRFLFAFRIRLGINRPHCVSYLSNRAWLAAAFPARTVAGLKETKPRCHGYLKISRRLLAMKRLLHLISVNEAATGVSREARLRDEICALPTTSCAFAFEQAQIWSKKFGPPSPLPARSRSNPTCAESVGRIKRINGLSEKSALQRRSDCDAVRR